MGLTEFTPNTLADANEVNSNFNITLRGAGLSWINALKDRSITFPADGGVFAEAYTSAGGRMGSVVTVETSASYDNNKYETRVLKDDLKEDLDSTYTFAGTTIDTDVWDSVVSGFIDGNRGAYNEQFDSPDRIRTRTQVSAIYNNTFSGSLTANQTNAISIKGKTIIGMDLEWSTSLVSSPPSGSYGRIRIKLRDDSTDVTLYERIRGGSSAGNVGSDLTRRWVYLIIDEDTDLAYLSFDEGKSYLTPIDISGLNDTQDWFIKFESGASHNGGGGSGNCSGEVVCYEVKTDFNVFSQLSDLYSNGIITHAIPAGRLPSNTSSSFLTFDSADFEEGSKVEYKLRNDTEDVETAWLNPNEIQSFTALGHEAEQLIVKLIPKDTSPTTGFPSIRGIALLSARAIQ